MPKTIYDLKKEDMKTIFGRDILTRGEDYYDHGCVRSLDVIDKMHIIGVVSGTAIYKTSITIKDNGIICDCSCPCDFSCKHAAALLFAWFSEKTKQPKTTLKQVLEKKSKKELIKILEKSVYMHPDIKMIISLEMDKILPQIKNLFSRFGEWKDVQNLIEQLENILENIQNNKKEWNKELFNNLKKSANIMIDGIEEIHDEGDLSIFLEDWFLLLGEMTHSLRFSLSEKKQFAEWITDLIKKDNYWFEGIYEKAIISMCKSKKDVDVAKKVIEKIREEDDEDYYFELLLEMYDNAGMDKEYLELAEEKEFYESLIDKLISLERFEDALIFSEIAMKKGKDDYYLTNIEKIKKEILKKLGRKEDVKKMLFDIVTKKFNISDFVELKKEYDKKEWNAIFSKIVEKAKESKKFGFLSRAYYHENNILEAYTYSKNIENLEYLEKLAQKLSKYHVKEACSVYAKLSFKWISYGSGRPYKEAGKMLKKIKKLDKKIFEAVKENIIFEYGKKWSLMEIIKKI